MEVNFWRGFVHAFYPLHEKTSSFRLYGSDSSPFHLMTLFVLERSIPTRLSAARSLWSSPAPTSSLAHTGTSQFPQSFSVRQSFYISDNLLPCLPLTFLLQIISLSTKLCHSIAHSFTWAIYKCAEWHLPTQDSLVPLRELTAWTVCCLFISSLCVWGHLPVTSYCP